MMEYEATQTTNIRVGNRLIEAKKGEVYELTNEEIERIPPGYFEAVSKAHNEPKEGSKKKKKGDISG